MKKQYPKKTKDKSKFLNLANFILVLMMSIVFIFSLFTLIYGVKTFWLGFHSIDLGQNMRYLNAELGKYESLNNFTIVESPLEGLTLSGEEVFRLGVFQLEASFWMIIISSFMIGMIIAWFVMSAIPSKRRK